MRSMIRTRLAAVLLVPALAGTGSCTATRAREFVRESYQAPEAAPRVQSRVFDLPRELIFERLLEVLRARDARLEDVDAPSGRIVARLGFRSAADRDAAVRMGVLRQVVTRTRRTYRSYWPLDARCPECIIRRGKIVRAETELVEDRRIPLAPGSYRIDPQLRARLVPAGSGTRVELSLELSALPATPPELAPESTGRLEAELLETLEASLRR